MSRSFVLGDAGDLRRDQLGTYERALAASGDLFRFRIGPPRVGLRFDAVFRPECAHDVLASRSGSYVKDVPAYTEVARIVGPGLLTSEGDVWRRDRRILQPVFTRRRVAESVDVIATGAADLVAMWGNGAGSGSGDQVVDLHAGATRYALRVLSLAVFGDDVEAAGPVIAGALPVLNEYATRRALSPLAAPAWWPSPYNRRAARFRRDLWDMVEELIARRSDGASHDDLLGRLLSARDPETGAALSRAAVRAHALTILLAGHETTASSLAFTLHLLGRYPAVQERVRHEVMAAVGEGRIAAAHLDGLRYTAQVVDEALRLYPPVHTLVRRAGAASTLCGHRIPRGRIVAVSVWGIHRNPAVWPEPERFEPDRFDGGEGAPPDDRYTHLPFGGGPRACLGRFLATAELVTAVAAVVRAYRIQSPEERPQLDAGITLRPAGALRCRLEPLAGAR
ncbi:MAG TPA: cytochrome P450 [Acidimicrobiales bacterium]|nr:cytochrome P450 [Acidimicrobiales bacterium]